MKKPRFIRKSASQIQLLLKNSLQNDAFSGTSKRSLRRFGEPQKIQFGYFRQLQNVLEPRRFYLFMCGLVLVQLGHNARTHFCFTKAHFVFCPPIFTRSRSNLRIRCIRSAKQHYTSGEFAITPQAILTIWILYMSLLPSIYGKCKLRGLATCVYHC